VGLNEAGPRGVISEPLVLRIHFIVFAFSFAILALLWRLHDLQVRRGEEMLSRGRQNFVQNVEVQHDRGIIFDRFGSILVDNRPSLNLAVTPHFLGTANDAQTSLSRVAKHVGLSSTQMDKIVSDIRLTRGLERFRPIVIKKDLQPDQVEALEADRSIFLLDGVNVQEGRRRTYRYGKLAAHLLGYVNEIGPEKLRNEKSKGNPLNYERGELIGRRGIEHRYEKELRGIDGYNKVVVDAKGRRMFGDYVDALLGKEHQVKPMPGNNVFLTIDLNLQLAAENAFDGQAGAIVALNPRNGEILAIVSRPAFDPNLVSGFLNRRAKSKLDRNPLKPWVNRVIQGQYAPGSTFKVVTALAALLDKTGASLGKVTCPGYYKLGRRVWRCHRDKGHGLVGLREALKVSCDTFFYAMGAKLGIDKIAVAGHLLGTGHRTSIELRGEKPGLMPTEEWHNQAEFSTGGYQRGMALNTAIGQGSVLMTPIQLAHMYATISQFGKAYPPKIVSHLETADFRVTKRLIREGKLRDLEGQDNFTQTINGNAPSRLESPSPKKSKSLPVESSVWESIHHGLVSVVNERGGTAYSRRSKLISAAGKTGTAQVIRLGKDRLKASEMLYEERDHAWYVTYAPISKPEIVIAVLNEHSGHGGSKAAPIANRVLDAYIDLKKQRRQSQVTLKE
jgi:penicillin-binding protein 2